MTVGWAAAGLAAIAGAPFLAEALRRPVAADRGVAPGQFAQLSDGVTHYQWTGPAEGPVALCVHGLTTPSYVWEDIALGLAERGFRVLRYDLFGRGWSDRPRGRQDRSFFLRQMRELLEHEDVGGPFTLWGYSMGGSIGAAFASEEPHRIARLVLVAPAGLCHEPGRLAETARRWPWVGDWLMQAAAGAALRRGTRALGPEWRDFATRQAREIGRRGYLPAVLSSQRYLLAEDLAGEHRRIRALMVPVMAIWGAGDTVIPAPAREALARANPEARQVVVPGAGHSLAFTHAAKVLAAFDGWQ